MVSNQAPRVRVMPTGAAYTDGPDAAMLCSAAARTRGNDPAMRNAIMRLVNGCLALRRSVRGESVPDGDVTVTFDDCIITDRNTDKRMMQAEVAAGIMPARMYLVDFYGMDEQAARTTVPQHTTARRPRHVPSTVRWIGNPSCSDRLIPSMSTWRLLPGAGASLFARARRGRPAKEKERVAPAPGRAGGIIGEWIAFEKMLEAIQTHESLSGARLVPNAWIPSADNASHGLADQTDLAILMRQAAFVCEVKRWNSHIKVEERGGELFMSSRRADGSQVEEARSVEKADRRARKRSKERTKPLQRKARRERLQELALESEDWDYAG